jgi:hypothetical protein
MGAMIPRKPTAGEVLCLAAARAPWPASAMVFSFRSVPRSAAQNPFEPAEASYFVWSTGGSGTEMSLLFPFRPGMTELERFPTGYTNLWVMRRLGLWQGGGRVVSLPPGPASPDPYDKEKGQFYAFDAGQKPSHWRFPDGKRLYGFAAEAEAAAWCQEQAGQGRTMMLAQLLEDVYWH